ncbi:MAG: hypothetical protein J1F25_07450 [Prevotellaceae bacterium]|nr:hypothetical protein [Prevotellaceae bacterium]
MNKATRINRSMMWGMMGMAIVLLIIVFGMLYYSMRNVQERQEAAQKATDNETITVIDETQNATQQ